jgi:hypothetical protein
MSGRTTEERLAYALNQLNDELVPEILYDRKKVFRLRSILIRALYWLDRYMSEKYFEEKAQEKDKEKPKIKPKKKR